MKNFEMHSKEDDIFGEKVVQKFVKKTCKNILKTI